MKIVLWILIIAAVVAVCAKKVRDIKNGKFCDCGCGDCKANCKKAKKFED